MHIPDGFISVPVAAAAAVVAAGGIAGALRSSRRLPDDAAAPLAGLVAVFVFAAQMVNFPIGAGTSGHLVGGALAAILVGPSLAVLAMTVVVVVQALVFADGGLLALGLNLTNLAIVAPVVGYLVFRTVMRIAAERRAAVPIAAGLAGMAAVLATASAFSLEFWLGGTDAVDASLVAAATIGVHSVIGIVEGVITALIVVAVLGLRTDLVAGVRRPRPDVVDQGSGLAGASDGQSGTPGGQRVVSTSDSAER